MHHKCDSHDLAIHFSADPLGSVYGQIQCLGNSLKRNALTPHIKDILLHPDEIAMFPVHIKLGFGEIRYYHEILPLCLNDIIRLFKRKVSLLMSVSGIELY